jgi:hypothetical protein
MEAKKQMVVLVANGQEREFEVSHAERLLKMANNGGWKLPEDSQFKYTDYGIGIKDDKRGVEGSEKKSNDKSSNSTSRKD